MLADALMSQSGLRGDPFGQEEVEAAGEILRTLWKEIGSENFVEWLRRVLVLVESEKVLLCGVRAQGASGEIALDPCTYSEGEPAEGEECYAACPVR